MKLLVLCSVLKNVLHVAGSGSAFNTLANAILILKVNGIHTVCKPLEPDVYDVPHCRLMNSGDIVGMQLMQEKKLYLLHYLLILANVALYLCLQIMTILF